MKTSHEIEEMKWSIYDQIQKKAEYIKRLDKNTDRYRDSNTEYLCLCAQYNILLEVLR